jgi:hypothetical protein
MMNIEVMTPLKTSGLNEDERADCMCRKLLTTLHFL